MALNPVYFAKCAPSIATNIKQCGTVTVCNNKPVTADEFSSIFQKSGDYRVMDALFQHEFEIKQCEAKQNGLYEFFMANKVPITKGFTTTKRTNGQLDIAPFIQARQYSPINNIYWNVTSGTASGANWSVRVASNTNVPADVRSFPVGLRVMIDGAAIGGSITHTAYKVISATLSAGGDYVTLILLKQNSASHLDTAKLGDPATGLLRRGTPNINDYEQWCNEMPSYLNWKDVEFWVETTRYSMCTSDQYRKWRALARENPLFREYGDLDDVQKNKQLAADWMHRFVDQAFWGKPLPNQDRNSYDLLESITSWAGVVDAGSNQILGADGSACVGKRANAVGIYEQMAECGRVVDLAGGILNIPALQKALYQMMRVRENANHPHPKVFDIFTDSLFANLFNRAMLAYYKNEANGVPLQLTKSVDREVKTAEFGFNYESYKLFWPAGMTINVITHEYFDDWISAAVAAGLSDTVGRVVWILDFTGIYPGIIASSRVTSNTGDRDKLAAINSSAACVIKTNTVEQTLGSVTWTMIVECPMANLIIEGIANTVPEHATLGSANYLPTHTETTTTTYAPFTG